MHKLFSSAEVLTFIHALQLWKKTSRASNDQLVYAKSTHHFEMFFPPRLFAKQSAQFYFLSANINKMITHIQKPCALYYTDHRFICARFHYVYNQSISPTWQPKPKKTTFTSKSQHEGTQTFLHFSFYWHHDWVFYKKWIIWGLSEPTCPLERTTSYHQPMAHRHDTFAQETDAVIVFSEFCCRTL